MGTKGDTVVHFDTFRIRLRYRHRRRRDKRGTRGARKVHERAREGTREALMGTKA